MTTETNINLKESSEDELLNLYSKHNGINIAHELWCRRYKKIPQNFSKVFMTLLERISRVTEKNSEGVQTPDIDLDALIDTIYISCRSMFCEDPDLKKNYTIQNCLRKAKYDKEAALIDSILLEENFTNEVMKNESFFSLVKLVSNKSIAHQENLSATKSEKVDYRYVFLNENVNVLEFQYYLFKAHKVYESVVKKYADKLLYDSKESK
ncbi:TPA: hypothetical protein ACGHH5_003200 [Salmonella enterica subsp. enterica serovar 1,4,[5],12:b:-]